MFQKLIHKVLLILLTVYFGFLLAACDYNPPAASADLVDGTIGADSATDSNVAIDVMPDASPDALVCAGDQVATPDGCQPLPRMQCSNIFTDANGNHMRRLDFTGWITYGLLDFVVPSGVTQDVDATPTSIAYGSDFDSSSVMSSCSGSNRWIIPYPAGCTSKPLAAWMGEPGTANSLVFAEGVENFNVAVIYSDGTYRWADIKLDDGDPDGFVVAGFGGGFNCHIVHPGGIGGFIQIAP